MWEKWARSQLLIFADFTEIIHKNGNYQKELVVPVFLQREQEVLPLSFYLLSFKSN